MVNRDNNSVSVIKVAGDINMKIAEIPVGKEPRCLAITPDDKKVFVTNMVDGTVSVIDAKKALRHQNDQSRHGAVWLCCHAERSETVCGELRL